MITKILPNGLMTILFSEKLKSLEDFKNEFDKRKLKEQFFEISYLGQKNDCTSIVPELIDWYITKFENDKIEIFLNITNLVYVSQNYEPDNINIRVLQPQLF